MIGYGFMGKTHSNGYTIESTIFSNLEYKPVLKAVCARNAEKAKPFADNGVTNRLKPIGESLLERDDIDAIDICTPNNLHKEIAIAAAKAGKMILCEKPLAMNAAEGEEMCEAVEKAGCCQHRLVQLPPRSCRDAGQAIDRLREARSESFTIERNFLQDWTINADVPQGGAATWRLDVEAAGSGVTGDLLAHCIDTAIWLNGSIKDVTAMTETFVKERMHAETGKNRAGRDRRCVLHSCVTSKTVRSGLFESTRYARGHKALYTFEINGEHAIV